MNTKLSEKAEQSLMTIVDQFKDGDLGEKLARAVFPAANYASSNWSLNNRFLTIIQSGTLDCRGAKQWRELGRNIKKRDEGGQAIFILRPWTVTAKNEETGEKEQRCIGFASLPVFPVYATTGAELDYEQIALPALPLLDVAERAGIDVQAVPFDSTALGRWLPTLEQITLSSPDEEVFFHELAHAYHTKLVGKKMSESQTAHREIVAELCAATLKHLYGVQPQNQLRNHFEYIQLWADEQEKSVVDACLAVLHECARVIELVVGDVEASDVNQPETTKVLN